MTPLHEVTRALTLHQPWATCIAHHGKRIENRNWSPPPRMLGQPLAIHAGKKLDRRAIAHLRESGLADIVEPLPQSVIVAVARVVDVVRLGDDEHGPLKWSPWRIETSYGWVLDEVTPIDPVPCRGAQGLWTIPPGPLRLVRELVAARSAA